MTIYSSIAWPRGGLDLDTPRTTRSRVWWAAARVRDRPKRAVRGREGASFRAVAAAAAAVVRLVRRADNPAGQGPWPAWERGRGRARTAAARGPCGIRGRRCRRRW